MNIVHFIVKDVFRKKLRVLLTMCGISIGICVCIIMLGVGESIKTSFKDTYGKRQIDIIIQEKDQLSILLSRVDDGITPGIAKIPTVEGAAATLLYIHKIKGSAVPVFGWGPDSFLFDDVELTQGRRPAVHQHEVMVGEALMKSLRKENEKQIKIKGIVFSVVGVFKSTSPFEQYAAVMPLPDLQTTIHEEGKASFINVRLKPAYRTEALIESIRTGIENGFPLVSVMRADAFIAEKTKFIVVGEQFSLLISLITIIAVALGLANTMVTSTFEKRKFLAILLALGWQKIEIAALFLCESLIVALAGGLIGIFLGFGMAKVITLYAKWETGFSLASILIAFGTSASVGLIFGLVPARRAARLNPVDALRFE